MSAEVARGPSTRRGSPGVSKLVAARGAGFPAHVAGAAVLGLVLLTSVAVLATGGRGPALLATLGAAAHTDLASAGFRVGEIHLQGASPAAQAEILRAAALKPGSPILDLDLAAVRQRVEQVGWVQSARVIRLLPDTLVISVVQRPLIAVWQHAGRTVVVANNGALVREVDPRGFGALPLIVGDGANLAAGSLTPLVMARPRLAARLDAMVRVDDRRWDLRLKDGALILLPAEDESDALKRLDALDRATRILDLGLARVDLRDPEMVVVRPREAKSPALAGGGV